MTLDRESEWFVYIIRADDESLYTGITTDLDRRLKQHQSGKGGAKYFRGRSACEYVYTETGHSRRSAAVREAQIKKMTRQQKCLLL
ncbi:MAG: GIY-YIG nuclease family protein [Porticoccaceae bacterium]|jgi:putative endonuclease|nr:GIY-YIG nuclease family protein [Porticoccaceae bacterium]